MMTRLSDGCFSFCFLRPACDLPQGRALVSCPLAQKGVRVYSSLDPSGVVLVSEHFL